MGQHRQGQPERSRLPGEFRRYPRPQWQGPKLSQRERWGGALSSRWKNPHRAGARHDDHPRWSRFGAHYAPVANNDGRVRPPGHNARRTGTIVGDRHAARLHGVDSSIWTITRLPTVRAVITLGLATGDAGTSGTHLGAAIFPAGLAGAAPFMAGPGTRLHFRSLLGLACSAGARSLSGPPVVLV